MLTPLVWLLLAVVSLTASTPDDVKLIKSGNQFALELFRQLGADSGYVDDVFLAPHSVYINLLLVYSASAGKTEKLLERVLHFDRSSLPDKNYIRKLLTEEIAHNSSQAYELYWVDRVYYSKDLKVKKGKETFYGTKVVAFKTEDPVKEVNDWVSKETKGIIKNFLDEEELKTTQSMAFCTLKSATTVKLQAAPGLTSRLACPPDNQHLFTTDHTQRSNPSTYIHLYAARDVGVFFHETNLNFIQVNAAYFKGLWLVPLDLELCCSEDEFTLHDGSVIQTTMMTHDGYVHFKILTDEELKSQVISIPYKGDDIFMVIILPTTKPQKGAPSAIADVVKKLTYEKVEKLEADFGKANKTLTKLIIPKFVSEGEYRLKQVFENLGDQELFTENMDLSNLFEPDQPLKVTDIAHKARVNVYEEGTEAAEATATMVANSAGLEEPQPVYFYADHPFVYAIYDKKHRLIHYIGLLNHPKLQ